MSIGVLYIVGTPIGNLGDMTERARDTLGSVDLIAAEDTRRTGRLLERFGITGRMVSLFEGNERSRTVVLLEALRDGRSVALVCDAGMPGLSDPGFRLVRACAEDGVEVRVVPGPSAAVAALVVSGLPTDRFTFEGFLPRKPGERRARLESLAHDPRTLVLFESPRRLQTVLREILELLGDRKVAIARELTKQHEEVIRGRVSEVLARIAGREPRGEIVVVLEGATVPAATAAGTDELLGEMRELVGRGVRAREAAGQLARSHDVSANDLYRAFLVARTREEREGPAGVRASEGEDEGSD